MAGIKDKMGKFKSWMMVDGDVEDDYEEYDRYDEYESDEEYDHADYADDEEYSQTSGSSIIPDYPTHNQMRVVIAEPKIYDDAQAIADHLKSRKTVILNLEGITQQNIKKSIFDFLNGAVYVLDGSVQRISKTIFIFAPKNVDIDLNIKKELESKAMFPWQNR